MSPASGDAERVEPAAPVGSPLLRVVRGEPTDEELGALTAVLAALGSASPSGGNGDPPPRRPSAWSDRSAMLRRPVHPGPGAWRASALPG